MAAGNGGKFSDPKAQMLSAVGNLSMGMICILGLIGAMVYGIYVQGNNTEKMIGNQERFTIVLERVQEDVNIESKVLEKILEELIKHNSLH